MKISESFASVKRCTLLTASIVALSVLTLVPRPFDFYRSFLGDAGDPSLYVATWRWQWYALSQGYIDRFWQGWFYYPNRWVMGYTEHILGLMPLYKVYEWIFSSAPAASTAVVISLFVFDGWAGYALGKRIGRSRGAGVAGAFVLSFSPFHYNQVTHMHVSAYFMVPLILVVLEAFLRRPTKLRTVGLGVLWGGTPLFSYSNWAIASVAVPVFAITWVVVNERVRRSRCAEEARSEQDRDEDGVEESRSNGQPLPEQSYKKMMLFLAVAGLLMIVLVIPFSFQFVEARSEVTVVRSSQEVVAYSAKISNLLQPPDRSLAYRYLWAPLGKNHNIETTAYLGIAGVLFVFIGFLWPLARCVRVGIQRRRLREIDPEIFHSVAGSHTKDKDFEEKRLVLTLMPWFFTAVAGFFLMLGPKMRIRESWPAVPGPYQLLMAVPGLSQLRAAGRFSLLVYVFVAACAASAWARLWRHSRIGAVFVVALCALWVLESAMTISHAPPLPANASEAPGYVRWLAAAEPGPTVELPIYTPGVPSSSFAEATRLYLSTYDFQPRVNGYSGYQPFGYSQTVSDLAEFPASEAIERLRELRVRYVVVDLPTFARYKKGGPDAAYYGFEYPDLPVSQSELRQEIEKAGAFLLRADFGSVIIYELVGVVQSKGQ